MMIPRLLATTLIAMRSSPLNLVDSINPGILSKYFKGLQDLYFKGLQDFQNLQD